MKELNYFDLNTYNYLLPQEIIAQEFLAERSDSKLLHYHTSTKRIHHTHFKRFPDFFTKRDVLVFNDTGVRKSRLHAKKVTGGKVEIILLKPMGETNKQTSRWLALLNPAKHFSVLPKSIFIDANVKVIVQKKQRDGQFEIFFAHTKTNQMLSANATTKMLERCSELPIPPYVKKVVRESARYQTIYGMHKKEMRSAAASTAGLHFDKPLLHQLKKKQVECLYLELEIGLGTFSPIYHTNLKQHVMHAEHYTLSQKVADRLNTAKKENKRIIAIGTTSLRALEDNYRKHGRFSAVSNYTTNLFIHPPQKIQSIDGLLTNFHLPKSSLFILLCTLLSVPTSLTLYHNAQHHHYRFFSLGDTMLIL